MESSRNCTALHARAASRIPLRVATRGAQNCEEFVARNLSAPRPLEQLWVYTTARDLRRALSDQPLPESVRDARDHPLETEREQSRGHYKRARLNSNSISSPA